MLKKWTSLLPLWAVAVLRFSVFYFKKSDGAWITKKITGKKIPLSWEFTPDEQARLRSEKKITFEHEK